MYFQLVTMVPISLHFNQYNFPEVSLFAPYCIASSFIYTTLRYSQMALPPLTEYNRAFIWISKTLQRWFCVEEWVWTVWRQTYLFIMFSSLLLSHIFVLKFVYYFCTNAEVIITVVLLNFICHREMFNFDLFNAFLWNLSYFLSPFLVIKLFLNWKISYN